VYSKYQLESDRFFDRQGAWSVAQAPSVDPRESSSAAAPTPNTNEAQAPNALASEAGTNRFTPYYTMFRDATGTGEDFVILRPFVPFSSDDRRTELQAYMTASSDPDNYGRLTAYVLSDLADGPSAVSNVIDSEPSITQQITLQTGGGNVVRFGDLQLVPVAEGLLWVRPFYAQVSQGSSGTTDTVTEYRFVIVSYNDEAVWGESLGDALAKLFDGYEGDLGDRVGPEEASTPEPPETGEPEVGTPEEVLAQADQLLREAADALSENGDLGEYQAKVDEAGALIDEALSALQPTATTPAGEPSTSSTEPAPPASAPTGDS
jgi:uncharacterized protein